MWESAGEAQRVSFGPVDIQTDAQPQVRFIVDGQQRVAALVGAMLRDEERPTRDYYAIWVDLDQRQFHRPLRQADIRPSWLPLSLLGQRTREILAYGVRHAQANTLQLFVDRQPAPIATSGLPCWFAHLLPEGPWRRHLQRWAQAGEPSDQQILNPASSGVSVRQRARSVVL